MEILLLLLVLTIIPIIIFKIYTWKNSRTETRLPPGPPGLPLIGNLHQLKEPVHEYYSNLSKKYGPIMLLKHGSRPIIIVSSSELAEEIMKTQDLVFCNRPTLVSFKKLSYDYSDIALSSYSEYWREMRKIMILHLLSAKRVQSFRPVRVDEVGRLVQEMSRMASRTETVNLTEKVVLLTSTTICRIAFGKRYEPGTWESKEFNRIILDFQKAMSGFYFADYFLWLSFVDKITGNLAHLDKVFNDWNAFYQDLIEEHLRPDRPKSMTEDVVDIMLRLREDKSCWAYDISVDHIKSVLMDVYFAATDTIATTTIWAMTALMRNPNILKKAQLEVRKLGTEQTVDEADIMSTGLPYLSAVIKETLRRYTTIPLLVARETREKCVLGGYEIPAKTMVQVNAWAIANDPKAWENPEEFKPERFLGDDRNFNLNELQGRDFDLTPFGGGRRGCPGITMALATIQFILANLLYAFDWELPDGMMPRDIDTDIIPGMTPHKKNPLRLVPKTYTPSVH